MRKLMYTIKKDGQIFETAKYKDTLAKGVKVIKTYLIPIDADELKAPDELEKNAKEKERFENLRLKRLQAIRKRKEV